MLRVAFVLRSTEIQLQFLDLSSLLNCSFVSLFFWALCFRRHLGLRGTSDERGAGSRGQAAEGGVPLLPGNRSNQGFRLLGFVGLPI